MVAFQKSVSLLLNPLKTKYVQKKPAILNTIGVYFLLKLALGHNQMLY